MSAAALRPPLGQGGLLQRLLRQARQGTMPHGVLIEGRRGTGKSTAVSWLSAALLCRSELDQEGPCGACRDCRRVASGQHPDLHLLTLPEERHEIPVPTVRETLLSLQRLPVEGGARVLCIDPADALNEEGHNTLLKALEEPGASTWLLLASAHPEALPATVRSRLQRLRLRPLPEGQLRAELARRLPERAAFADRAVALAGGSLGLALELCTEQAVQLHDLVVAALAAGDRLRPVATARAVLAGAGERLQAIERARTFLDVLRAELRLRLRTHLEAAGGGPYAAAASEPWASLVECALAAERDLHLRIPPDQVLAGLLLRCFERLR